MAHRFAGGEFISMVVKINPERVAPAAISLSLLAPKGDHMRLMQCPIGPRPLEPHSVGGTLPGVIILDYQAHDFLNRLADVSAIGAGGGIFAADAFLPNKYYDYYDRHTAARPQHARTGFCWARF